MSGHIGAALSRKQGKRAQRRASQLADTSSVRRAANCSASGWQDPAWRLAVADDGWVRRSLSLPLPHVDEMPGDRGGGRHRRRDQMGAALVALAALEIAVRGRGA